jgi:hypothetical protein
MEVASEVRPTRRFQNPNTPVRVRLVELPEPGVGVGLEDAPEVLEMLLGMLALAVRREVIDRARRSRSIPGAIIADISPDPSFTPFPSPAERFPRSSTLIGVSSA